jgi:hypothetical protein
MISARMYWKRRDRGTGCGDDVFCDLGRELLHHFCQKRIAGWN